MGGGSYPQRVGGSGELGACASPSSRCGLVGLVRSGLYVPHLGKLSAHGASLSGEVGTTLTVDGQLIPLMCSLAMSSDPQMARSLVSRRTLFHATAPMPRALAMRSFHGSYAPREPTTNERVLPRWAYFPIFPSDARCRFAGSSNGTVTSMMRGFPWSPQPSRGEGKCPRRCGSFG